MIFFDITYCFGEFMTDKKFTIEFKERNAGRALSDFQMIVAPVFVVSIQERHLKLNYASNETK